MIRPSQSKSARRALRARIATACARYWRGEKLRSDELAEIERALAPAALPPASDAALGAVALQSPAILATVDSLAADLQALGLRELEAWQLLTSYCRRGHAVTLAEAG